MGWYYVVTEEMRQLGLNGNELTVFAVIHGFSQQGAGCYYGTKPHLAEICGISKRSLDRILITLQERELLESKPVVVGNRASLAYYTPCNFGAGVQNWRKSETELHPINNSINTFSKEKGVDSNAHARGFKAPTVEEVAAYCRERGNGIDPAEFIDHYTSNGWLVGKVPMRDWRAAVRTWERKRERETSPAAPSIRRGGKHDYVLENLRAMDELQGTHYVADYLAGKEVKI